MRPIRLNYLSGVTQALATMRGNPLRASLAGLAMAAAVATTAITMTALNGLATQARLTSARAFGADTFVIGKVFGTGLSRRELAERVARNPDVTRADLRFLDRYAGGRVLYSALTQRAADVTAGGRRFENAAVNGAGAALVEIRDIGLERGRFFGAEEVTRAAQVAVVGAAVVDALFPAVDPLGAAVRIGGRRFTVIGVQARQGSAGGVSLDRYVWIPLPAFERAFGAPGSLQLFARATEGAGAVAAEDHARASLRARRQLGAGVLDNFDVLTPDAGRSFVQSITERAGAAGPPISFMALLAAMIVVVNTTLVSVTERTREIGVRRALGANRGQVVVEVLAESGLTALGGGVAGLALSALVLRGVAQIAGLPLALDTTTVAYSLTAAAVSGIVAGWYPARRAARADVVTSLRAE